MLIWGLSEIFFALYVRRLCLTLFILPHTLKMLDKISIRLIFFIIFHEFVTLLPIFLKQKQANSYMRCVQKNIMITPGVTNETTEIEQYAWVVKICRYE